jgi:hypothetical protein
MYASLNYVYVSGLWLIRSSMKCAMMILLVLDVTDRSLSLSFLTL